MSRNNPIIQKLKDSEAVSFRPKGQSMSGKIESGQLCTLRPVGEDLPEKGDVVYCKVKGRVFLHLCTAVHGKRYQISNNHGHVNGWITINNIYGVLTKVEP